MQVLVLLGLLVRFRNPAPSAPQILSRRFAVPAERRGESFAFLGSTRLVVYTRGGPHLLGRRLFLPRLRPLRAVTCNPPPCRPRLWPYVRLWVQHPAPRCRAATSVRRVLIASGHHVVPPGNRPFTLRTALATALLCISVAFVLVSIRCLSSPMNCSGLYASIREY